MKRRNYTREVLGQIKAGRIAVRSVGGTPEPVTYQPRSKNDPQPWTDGLFRFNGREVHTVEACGHRLLDLLTGRFTRCTKQVGHSRAHASN